MNRLVSVVIALGPGGEKHLKDCISAVYNQSYSNVEIVMVGKPRAEAEDTRSLQKNRAILASQGEFVFRVDADIILMPDVIEKAVAMCESGYDFVAVTNRSPPSKTILGKTRQLEWEMLGRGKYHMAGNFTRRTDVIRAGLFNSLLYAGEEYDLHNRMLAMGLKFGVLEGSYALHMDEPDTMRDVVKKNLYYGRNISSFVSKNGVVQMQPFRLAYLKAVPSFGLYFIPFIFYKMIQYASAGLGLLMKEVRTD